MEQQTEYTDAQICSFIIITFFEHSHYTQKYLPVADIAQYINNKVSSQFDSRLNGVVKGFTPMPISQQRIQGLLDQMHEQFILGKITHHREEGAPAHDTSYAWVIASGPDGVWQN